MSRDSGGEQGQAIALVVLALVTLLGMGAIATDVGFAWYAKRQLQASADAAALAGAQDLPNVTAATASASTYAATNQPRNLQNVSWTVSTSCTRAAAACAPANSVVVDETATMKTAFAGVVGLRQINLSARATACQPCGTAPFDIMVVLDRTGSMCQPKVNGQCVDLNNAKQGVRTLLGLMEPDVDKIGMVAFPPVRAGDGLCDTPWPSTSADYNTYGHAWYDSPDRKYVTDPLGGSYKRADGTLDPSSSLVSHLAPGDETACITDGGSTSYSTALQVAQNELATHGRPGVPKVIIFMTDGEANIGPVWTCSRLPAALQPGCTNMPATGPANLQPCHTAINVANSAKAAGTILYTIGYDLTSAGTNCLAGRTTTNSSGQTIHVQGTSAESPTITATSTLQQIASPGNFYDKPTAGQLNTIFTAIAADLTHGTSRLVDDSY